MTTTELEHLRTLRDGARRDGDKAFERTLTDRICKFDPEEALLHDRTPASRGFVTRSLNEFSTIIGDFVAAAVKPLQERIAKLEEQQRSGGVKWAGIWAQERQYAEGELATHAGALWLAQRTNVGRRPGDAECWKLVCKSHP